jgi:hypothetical protein
VSKFWINIKIVYKFYKKNAFEVGWFLDWPEQKKVSN